MYNQSSSKYPIVYKVEVSTDSVTWKEIRGFIQTFTEQNDFYIRFGAEKIRYVRLRFLQEISEYLETGFGLKNRYSIALREIQIITNEFADTGAYVSIPLSTGSPISNVTLTSQFISENGISFHVSANNGGTWLPIVPNGTKLSLINSNSGVTLVENIKTVRVRIGMARAIKSSLLANTEQTFTTSSTGSYQLKGTPSNISAYIGGHISCGGDTVHGFVASQSSTDFCDRSTLW